MNTPEQSLRDDHEKLLAADARRFQSTSIASTLFAREVRASSRRLLQVKELRAPQKTTSKASTLFSLIIHWLLTALMPLAGIAVISRLLRATPADLLRQEFDGLVVVVCALAYVGIFLWRVSRALAQDTRQAGELDPGLGLCRSRVSGVDQGEMAGFGAGRPEHVALRT